MAARYILAAFAVVFLAAAVRRAGHDGGISHPKTKTWLLIGAIFAAVSAWLFSQE